MARKRKTPQELLTERKQARIDYLEKILVDFGDQREKKEKSLVDQLRQQSRLIDRMKLDHHREAARLGARIAALEYTTVLAHAHAGLLSSKAHALEDEKTMDLSLVGVSGNSSDAATPAPAYTPQKYRKNGERWELIVA